MRAHAGVFLGCRRGRPGDPRDTIDTAGFTVRKVADSGLAECLFCTLGFTAHAHAEVVGLVHPRRLVRRFSKASETASVESDDSQLATR